MGGGRGNKSNSLGQVFSFELLLLIELSLHLTEICTKSYRTNSVVDLSSQSPWQALWIWVVG